MSPSNADAEPKAVSRVEMILDRLRPEWRAGGYARDSGGVTFFTRVNALLEPDMVLVDFGAGRGEIFHGLHSSYYQRLARLQGKVRRVIGLDLDASVRDHPFLDERHVILPGRPLPLADSTVDMVVADWVFEHVEDPRAVAREFERILKPGGWICARTPNKWGYVGIGARLIPNHLHLGLLRSLWPGRREVDVFSTHYSLNSMHEIGRTFPSSIWENLSYFQNATPKYFGTSKLLFLIIDFVQNIVVDHLRTDLIVLLKKR
jgi:SAM-dependent methyltransferase